jgi:hypothetical protein
MVKIKNVSLLTENLEDFLALYLQHFFIHCLFPFQEKVNLFKKPMTNYHIPQNSLLKFKFYYKFLMANNREVAKEVKDQVESCCILGGSK